MQHFKSTTLGEALGADVIDEDAILELSAEYLMMVHGGGSRTAPPVDTKPQYGPPPPPAAPQVLHPLGGGLPPGAPGLAQPGNNAGQTFMDGAMYGGRHAVAEALDVGAAKAPFPVNYALDKLSDAVRPAESSFQEYQKKHH